VALVTRTGMVAATAPTAHRRSAVGVAIIMFTSPVLLISAALAIDCVLTGSRQATRDRDMVLYVVVVMMLCCLMTFETKTVGTMEASRLTRLPTNVCNVNSSTF
jgi:hypothetical protein